MLSGFFSQQPSYHTIPDIESGINLPSSIPDTTPSTFTSFFTSLFSFNPFSGTTTTSNSSQQHGHLHRQSSSSSIPLLINTDHERNSTTLQCPLLQATALGWYEDVKLFAPLLTFLSLFIGTIFYCWDNDWSLSTSFFYAVSTLFGVLFYLPVNKTWFGNIFTIFYYIYGAFFFAGVIGTYGGWLIAKAPEIYAEERRKLLAEEPEDFDGDGVVGFWDRLIYIRDVIHYQSGWEHHSSKYLTLGAVCFWVLVGTIYGVYYEGWTVITSTVFSISTISAAANIPPQCVGTDLTECKIGFFREMFLAIYMLVGCPLFTLALGQFAKFMIDRAVKRHEIEILHTPITQEEFKYAATLYGDDPDVMSLGEFTILELLRLQRITLADLEQIKTLYLSIDENATGRVNKPMLVTRNLMRPYGSFDETMLSTHKGLLDDTKVASNCGDGTMSENFLDTDLEFPHTIHMLTENDRANSLPPGEITDHMYRSVSVNFMDEDEELKSIHQQFHPPTIETDISERSQFLNTPHITPHAHGRRPGHSFSFKVPLVEYEDDQLKSVHLPPTIETDISERSQFPNPPHVTPHAHGRRPGHSFSFKVPLVRHNTNDSSMLDHETIYSHHDSEVVPMGIKRFGFEEYNEIVVPLAVTTALEGPVIVDDEESRVR